MGSDEQNEHKKYSKGKGERQNNNFFWRNALPRVQIIKLEESRENSRD